ncbi:putative ribosomally synthesized peptide with SipW-like signal peptide [Neobacillus niacini]|uniref:TasA family protein n=1 Tax=Neobacillus niacini TaxID=86668 RepID=UPI002781D409|nr:TasA family protein [Neobacillus niacini]MDQ1001883.1 putative ribosomally synthesized peptide with SipW-like signal peptide [Neobacillus niacini]
MTIKKRLALLSVTGLVGMGLTIGGATYALFTDSAQSKNNTITSGSIDISEKRDRGDSVPGPMFYSSISDTNTTDPGKYAYDVDKANNLYPYGGEAKGGWAPGDSVQRTMIVESEGSLEARLKSISATVKGSYDIMNGPTVLRTITGVTSSSLGDDLVAYNMFIAKMNVTITAPGNIPLYNGPLSTLLTGYNLPSTLLYPLGRNGSETALDFLVTLDKSATNEIMGKNIIFDFTINAEQVRNN